MSMSTSNTFFNTHLGYPLNFVLFSMQKNIDDYFINKSKKDLPSINLKKYFYLSWTTKNKPDNDAYWTETKPDKINFIEKICLNRKFHLQNI